MAITKDKPLTVDQLVAVLNDIAEGAEQMQLLAAELDQKIGTNTNAASALAGAICALAQRVGFVADHVVERVGGAHCTVRGNAVDWMLPALEAEAGLGAEEARHA